MKKFFKSIDTFESIIVDINSFLALLIPVPIVGEFVEVIEEVTNTIAKVLRELKQETKPIENVVQRIENVLHKTVTDFHSFASKLTSIGKAVPSYTNTILILDCLY